MDSAVPKGLAALSAHAGHARFAIDAGGSRTFVHLQRRDGQTAQFEHPSCAIASVGAEQAIANLARTLSALTTRLGDDATDVVGYIAASSMPFLHEGPSPLALVDVITRAGIRGCISVVNDLVPMLWSAHVGGNGLVLSAGTGSSVIGRTSEGALLKVGGHEYVLSDDGSGYHLGLQALRAATRAVDGTGEWTVLVERALDTYGESLPALGRRLAEVADRRFQVARFAPEVIAAYDAGDGEATRIVTSEGVALARNAVTAMERLGFSDGVRVGMSGGVLRNSHQFRAVVTAAMTELGPKPSVAVLDQAATAMQFVAVLERADVQALTRAVGGMTIEELLPERPLGPVGQTEDR